MDVLDGAESLLPQFKLNRGIELGEAGVEMVLEGVSVRQVDGMRLMRVFRYI